ncbi:hypothetical protein ABZT03_40395 [Streptomyces sp. NPDC005574]|uniref:hypothetical protein n=1 Tax=Streptomyces sp. NPDC005574 TaxID=3156891 RepID=UPI0033A645DA
MMPLPARVTGDPLRLVLLAIAAVTVVTGACQLIAPGPVLRLLATGPDDPSALSLHFFATVGMFMVVVGGLLAQQLLTREAPGFPLLWVGLQKFGAFALVTVGVARGLLIAAALLVALFDLATAGLCGLLWRRGRRWLAGVVGQTPKDRAGAGGQGMR